MKLKDLYKDYAGGKLDKQKYIRAMHKRHQALFEYADYLMDTDLENIILENGQIYGTLKGSGIKLLMDRNDARFIPVEILNFHSFDAEERELLFSIARESRHVLDIGANIGWYALNFAKLPGVKKIYAFEPIYQTYSYLQRHVALNGVKGRVFPQHVGLSDKIEEIDFYWTNREYGAASMKNIQRRTNIEKIRCRVTTMDQFMKNRRFAVDLIKCDVEGAELFVFKGGRQTLQKDKPAIYTEMLRKWAKRFGYHPNDIISLLSELGYRCFGYVNGRVKQIERVTDRTVATNFFFLHPQKHKRFIKSF